jgi:lysozyme
LSVWAAESVSKDVARRTPYAALLTGLWAAGCTSEPAPQIEAIQQAFTRQCAPAGAVEGVDVSDHQPGIDWKAVAASGRGLAIMKATQGTYNRQQTFAGYWAGAKAAGMVRIPYHYFDGKQDGVAQANFFLKVVGPLGPEDGPPMLDLECPTSANQATASANCEYAGNSGWAPIATLRQRVFDWLDTVEKATGRKALIYSYPAWFADNQLTDAKLADYPLFIATLGSCAAVPAPWKSAKIWQYSWTGRVPGIAQDVDMDRFLGNMADLLAWVKSTSSHAAPMPAPDAGAAAKLDGAAAPAADARPSDARADAGGTGGATGTGGAGGAAGAAGVAPSSDPGDPNGPSAGPHGADGGASSESAEGHESHGCSYGRGGAPGCAWLMALALAALVRRRRTR